MLERLFKTKESRDQEDQNIFIAQIKLLENEIRLMKSVEVENQYNLPRLESEIEENLYNDPKYLDLVISDYNIFYEHILKFLSHYQITVPKDTLDRYFDLFKKFEEQVRRFDPDWPDLN